MRKYWTAFKVNWQASLAYRASFLIFFFVSILQTVFLLYLWFAVYNEGGRIGDYTFRELLTYYILQFVLGGIVTTFISWDMMIEIKEGHFSHYLVRPIDYFKWQAALNFSGKGVELLLIIVGLVVVSAFALRYVLLPASPVALLHTIILTLLATVLAFVLDFIIGLAALWLTDAFGFKFLTMGIIRFFAGNFIPLALLPSVLVTVSQFLPFPYLMYVPAQMYLGRFENVWSAYLGMIFWIIVLYALARFVLRIGIKRFEAVGT